MKSVAQRNAEVTLQAIRDDIVAATRELGQINAAIDTTAAEHNEIERKHAAAAFTISEGHKQLYERSEAVAAHERSFEDDKARRNLELASIEAARSTASEEFSRLGNLIVAVNEEMATHERNLATLREKEAALVGIDQAVTAAQELYLREEKRLTEMRFEKTRQLEEANAKLAKTEAEAKSAEKRTTSALDEFALAIIERDKAIKEKDRIRNDCDIYIRRIEEKYGQAFPGLRMIF